MMIQKDKLKFYFLTSGCESRLDLDLHLVDCLNEETGRLRLETLKHFSYLFS